MIEYMVFMGIIRENFTDFSGVLPYFTEVEGAEVVVEAFVDEVLNR